MTRSTHTPRRPVLSRIDGGTVETKPADDGYDVSLTLAGHRWVRVAGRAEAVEKAMRRAFGEWAATAEIDTSHEKKRPVRVAR